MNAETTTPAAPCFADVLSESKPHALASFIHPDRFAAAGDLAKQIESLQAEQEAVNAKAIEVDNLILSAAARRVRSIKGLADVVMAGSCPREDDSAATGLETLSTAQLRDIKESLRQKSLELDAQVKDARRAATRELRNVAKEAAEAAAKRYCELIDEVSALHVQLGAAEALLDDGTGRCHVVPRWWSSVPFFAPVIGAAKGRTTVITDPERGVCEVLSVKGDKDRSEAVKEWTAAARAATGLAL